MDPWYSGRLEVEEVIIPEALKENGYVSGHIGKWHMSLDHHSYPQPMDQGFDFTKAHLGESAKMKPHRLTGFATSAKERSVPVGRRWISQGPTDPRCD